MLLLALAFSRTSKQLDLDRTGPSRVYSRSIYLAKNLFHFSTLTSEDPGMVNVSPQEPRNYHKEFNKLQNRSDYYRRKCARRALNLSRVNKVVEVSSITLGTVVAGTLTAALSGFLPVQPVQMLAIVFSALIALLHALTRAFFNPGEIVKLFYVAGEFLEIRERAGKGKLHCRIKGNAELCVEYDELIEKYTGLRRSYIEYIRTFLLRHKRRKLKQLGGRFTELPPMKRKSSAS